MFIDFTGHPIYADGIYAILHSTAYDESKRSPHKSAVKAWEERGKPSLCTFWTMEDENSLHCLSVKAIESTSYVIPDFSDLEMTTKTNFVIQVKATDEWAETHNLR